MKPLITINDPPGTEIVTYDATGAEIGREVVQGHFIDRETVCCALALALVAAGIALILLIF